MIQQHVHLIHHTPQILATRDQHKSTIISATVIRKYFYYEYLINYDMLKTTTDGKFTFYNEFQHFPQNPVIFY